MPVHHRGVVYDPENPDPFIEKVFASVLLSDLETPDHGSFPARFHLLGAVVLILLAPVPGLLGHDRSVTIAQLAIALALVIAAIHTHRRTRLRDDLMLLHPDRVDEYYHRRQQRSLVEEEARRIIEDERLRREAKRRLLRSR